MSDWLVSLQEKLAGYPTWLVIGGAVIVVAVIFMLLGRVLRILGVVMFFVLAIAGVWFAWQRLTDDPDEADAAPMHRLREEASPTAPSP
ncbi:MAG: hypothetical protein ACREIA_16190 [Opitutaceae bacterium]